MDQYRGAGQENNHQTAHQLVLVDMHLAQSMLKTPPNSVDI
uniref:Uncharacterized protein n=1 Tax=Agrobacterium tumefaciens TaxID=358 RepID=A0A2P0QK25_AGRTU|nr:hypothetical protein AgrTiChry5_221 [Agrobacterium tumefaciens]